jgi:hypothetical protein
MMRLWFALGVVAAIGACKAQTDNSLADAATTSSFKTGFFLPRTKSDYQLAGRATPIAVSDFLAKARRLTGQSDLRLLFDPKVTYATTVNGQGEQLLLMISKEGYPLPVMSISQERVWSWHQQFDMDLSKKELGMNELFVRAPFGASPLPLIVENMFVRRSAQNERGLREPVLVPWLAHVRSETDNVVTFQLGNSILDGRLGYPLLEFRQPSSKPIWFVVGRYKDKDVEAGTVFWRPSDRIYYSLTAGRSEVVKWQVQDGDSLDRVETVALNSVQVPTAAKDFLDSLATLPAEQHPRNVAISGFDAWAGDQRVFQLDRNSMTIVDTAAGTRLSLAGSSDAEVLTDEDYKPQSKGMRLGWWNSNTPVTTYNKADGSGLQGASWTDQDGVKHGGTVLASRNVHVPGGMWSSGSYEQRHFVHNATNNTVSEVASDGRVIRSGMPVSEFQNRQQTNINIDEMQRAGGVDSRVMRQSQALSARTQRQLEISETYVAGRTTAESAMGIGRDLAIGQVRTQIAHGLSPDGVALERIVGDQVTGAIKGTNHGFVDASQTFLGTSQQIAAETGITAVGDMTAQSVWRNSNLSATASKSVGQGVSGTLMGASQMYFKYDELNKARIFDPTDPDAAFNSQIGATRVVGSGVQAAAGLVFSQGKALGEPGNRASSAVQMLVNDSTGVLFDEAAALSHGLNAQVIERERGELLEGVGQRMRDADAAETSLGALKTLETTQGGVMGPQPNSSSSSVSAP